MKVIIVLIVFMPLFVYAQEGVDTSANRIVITQEENECINKIFENPDALKVLVSKFIANKERSKQLYRQFINDPEINNMVRELKNMLREEEMK